MLTFSWYSERIIWGGVIDDLIMITIFRHLTKLKIDGAESRGGIRHESSPLSSRDARDKSRNKRGNHKEAEEAEQIRMTERRGAKASAGKASMAERSEDRERLRIQSAGNGPRNRGAPSFWTPNLTPERVT